jgi:hypothetical protein
MRRLHLFEREDFEWFRAVLRDAATADLQRAVEITGQAKKIAPKLRQAAEASDANGIVDLCSGGAEPVVELARALADEG